MSKAAEKGVHVCDVCGKTFIRTSGTIYKMTWKGRHKDFCGWNCYNRIVKLKDNKMVDEIDAIFAKGKM